MAYLAAGTLIAALVAATLLFVYRGELRDVELAPWAALTAAVIAACTALVSAFQTKKNSDKQAETAEKQMNLARNLAAKQEKLARDLAEAQEELVREMSQQEGELTREVVKLNEESEKRLSEIRRIAESTYPAHGDIYRAASGYYAALRPMELNEWSASAVEAAARRADEVSGLKIYVNEEFWESWLRFQQLCMNVEDERKLACQSGASNGREPRDIWEEYYKLLAGELAELERLVKDGLGLRR